MQRHQTIRPLEENTSLQEVTIRLGLKWLLWPYLSLAQSRMESSSRCIRRQPQWRWNRRTANRSCGTYRRTNGFAQKKLSMITCLSAFHIAGIQGWNEARVSFSIMHASITCNFISGNAMNLPLSSHPVAAASC